MNGGRWPGCGAALAVMGIDLLCPALHLSAHVRSILGTGLLCSSQYIVGSSTHYKDNVTKSVAPATRVESSKCECCYEKLQLDSESRNRDAQSSLVDLSLPEHRTTGYYQSTSTTVFTIRTNSVSLRARLRPHLSHHHSQDELSNNAGQSPNASFPHVL